MAGQRAFDLDDLIACYRSGVFPMAETRDDERLFLVEPEHRGVIPLRDFHIPHRLARTIRQDRFEVRIDTAFDAVVEACAGFRASQPETWISTQIQVLYNGLFTRGLAHSVECWREGRLAGGLYGVALGSAFFGESMVSGERDASKVALVHLVARLVVGGFSLLDTQFLTEHLTQFGAHEISRLRYRALLDMALVGQADFYKLAPATPGAAVLQAINQMS